MAIRMLEKQTINGNVVDRGDVVSLGDSQERTFIAHGKAEKVIETKPAAYSRKKGDE